MVSIIIPAYDPGECIWEALVSVLQQTYKDVEIIVIDDGFIDNTRAIIHECYPMVRYIFQSNRGAVVNQMLGST